MTRQKLTKKIKLSTLSMRLRVIVVAVFMVVGSYLIVSSQAAAGFIYMAPNTTSRYVNDTFAVQVRVSSTTPINAAFVDINYNGIGLRVVSIQRGTDFPNANGPNALQHTPSSTGTGRIRMQSTRNTTSAGNFHYATITFRATKTGTYGVTPINTSRIINYPQNEVSYTIGRGDYSFSNPPAPALPPPVPPASPPPPSSPPPPTPPKPPASPTGPRPAPSTNPTVAIPKTESAPSASSLKISDFAITTVGYRSALVTWKTSKPATSKVNYGFGSEHMTYEVTNQAQSTTHSLAIQGDAVRAGKLYYLRITSNDGAGPVTLDGTFTTKSVPIRVLVNSQQNQPVIGATVTADEKEATTDEQGMVDLAVPEGTVTISAKKDDQSGDLDAEVTIPEAESTAPQQFTVVALGSGSESSTQVPEKSNQGGSWWKIVLPFLGGAGIIAVLLVRRRKRRRGGPSVSSYHGPSVSIAPDPTNVRPAHRATLPELVLQDLGAKNKGSARADEPEDMFSALDKPTPSTPPPIHHVTSQHPHEPEQKAPPRPAPEHHTEEHHAEAPKPAHEPDKHPAEHKPEHEPTHPHHKEVEIDPKDHSLRIHHDK
jgi:hypothetical protein